MSMVGKHIRQGVVVNGNKAIEYIQVLEERIDDNGNRKYYCRVMLENKGFHRLVNADKYDSLYLSAATATPKLHRKYKGEPVGKETRTRNAL